jgi:hypothetical protein
MRRCVHPRAWIASSSTHVPVAAAVKGTRAAQLVPVTSARRWRGQDFLCGLLSISKVQNAAGCFPVFSSASRSRTHFFWTVDEGTRRDGSAFRAGSKKRKGWFARRCLHSFALRQSKRKRSDWGPGGGNLFGDSVCLVHVARAASSAVCAILPTCPSRELASLRFTVSSSLGCLVFYFAVFFGSPRLLHHDRLICRVRAGA